MHVSRLSMILSAAFFLAALPTPAEENLDRGLTAVQTPDGVFLSWRMFESDASDTAFDLFRDGTRFAQTSPRQGTNWLDTEGNSDSRYAVGVRDGKPEKDVSVWKEGFRTLTLDRPQGRRMPDGTGCEYAPNDMSVGDLDGDGRYELVVKWCPSNAKDNAHSGFTGNTIFVTTSRSTR